MIRLRVVYSGRVQGVGFRATAASIATGHPVRGFVRNQDDGTVELVVEGETADVRGFLAAIAKRFERNIRSTREEPFEGGEVFRAFEVRV